MALREGQPVGTCGDITPSDTQEDQQCPKKPHKTGQMASGDPDSALYCCTYVVHIG